MSEIITTEKAERMFAGRVFPALDFWARIVPGTRTPATIPLSEERARIFAELGFDLFYIPPVATNSTPISPAILIQTWESIHADVPILYDLHDPHKWYTSDAISFFYQEFLLPGWICIKSEPLSGAYFSTYMRQAEILAEYLRSHDIAPQEEISKPPQQSDPTLARCDINKKYRTSFVEELMRMMVVYCERKERSLERAYTWTNTVFQEKEIVRIGAFDESGADVTKRDVFDGNSKTGLTPVVHLGMG